MICVKREWITDIHDGLCILLNHLLFVAGAITARDVFQAESSLLLLWVAMIIFPCIWYYFKRKTPQLIFPPIVMVLLGILSIAERKMITNEWSMYYYVIAFLYLIGCFVYYFVKRFLDFLKLNEYTASNIPSKDIFQNGMKMTVLFSACSSVILLLSLNIEWVKAIVDRIWSVVLAFLSFLFSGIKPIPPEVGGVPVPPQEPSLGGSDMNEIVPEQSLEGVRDFLIAFTVMGFIIFLYYVYHMVKGIEVETKKRSKEKLADSEDIREYCGLEKNASRRLGRFHFPNNREKVRRLYQKKVIKRKRDLIGEQEQQQLKYLTAKECCDKLSEQKLKLAYEKARYSQEDITVEDVRLAK